MEKVEWSIVVAVTEVSSSMPKEQWQEDMPLPGDIILDLNTTDGIPLGMETFYTQKAALENELRQNYNRTEDALRLKVRRSHSIVDLKVYVIAEESCMPKKHYTIRAFADTRHVVVLDECTYNVYTNLQECSERILKTYTQQRIESKAFLVKQRTEELLNDRRFGNNTISYPWESKMDANLPAERSSMMFTLLFVPPRDDSCDQWKAVEDTATRAMTWLCAAQSSGVPIMFVNIQTELILDTPNKMAQLFNDSCNQDSAKSGSILRLTDSGRYMIDSWERLKIEIARGVRLWYAPVAAELPVDLKLDQGQTRYGLNVNRTEEGFFYISAVDSGSVSEEAGLKRILQSAMSQEKHLVISRVAGKKVTPWMVSSAGLIHCYDPVALGEALIFARCINGYALIHVMLCEGARPESMDNTKGIKL
ncbi:uncharacterized protein LOC131077573 [Cryptomeria japonica]|uniref:uncharacterized protein LOC131077573 n=1 Tax=Cryptomeria japonica TaxID=3369 RepID=UPI0025AC810A|nr:uncharacterized protein LOC131077573 [Cryptomeria japonica]